MQRHPDAFTDDSILKFKGNSFNRFIFSASVFTCPNFKARFIRLYNKLLIPY